MNNAGWIITLISSSSYSATTDTVQKLQVTRMGKVRGGLAIAQDCSSLSEFYFFNFVSAVRISFTSPPSSGWITASGRQGTKAPSKPSRCDEESEQVPKPQQKICSADEKWGAAGQTWGHNFLWKKQTEERK